MGGGGRPAQGLSYIKSSKADFGYSLALLFEYRHSPLPLLWVIERSIPIWIKQLVAVAEAPLNRVFAKAIAG